MELSSNDQELIKTMNLLADETRYKMFQILARDSELCVSEIASLLNVSVPAISQQFRVFELSGVVTKKRNGQKICYELKRDSPLLKKFELLSN